MTTPSKAQIEAAARGIPRATAYAEQIIAYPPSFTDINLIQQYAAGKLG